MKQARAGYSLFEVLIAFAIMSMMLAVLIPGQARLLGRSTAADEQFLASDYALSVLESAGIVTSLEPGEITSTYRDWQVRTIVKDTVLEDETSLPVREITVLVSTEAGRQLADVTTLRALK